MGNQYIDVRKEYVERVKRELLGPGSEVCIPRRGTRTYIQFSEYKIFYRYLVSSKAAFYKR